MTDDLLAIEEELQGYPGNLVEDFRRSSDALRLTLSGEQLRIWATESLELAKHSLRSWEATGEFLRASPTVLSRISFPAFRIWVLRGRELADCSSMVARAYFRATPDALAHLDEEDLSDWARLGSSLYKGTWKSISLAAQLLELSPQLLAQLDIAAMRTLVTFTDQLSERSYDLAFTCLDLAPRSLATARSEDRVAIIEFATTLVEHSWADARIYFERAPGLVNQLDPMVRGRYMRLVAHAGATLARQTYPYFAEGANALSRVDPSLHGPILDQAEPLADVSGVAAMEFVKSAPEVLERLRGDAFDAWFDQGRQMLARTIEGGEAFFRLESSFGEQVLERLSSRMALGSVAEVLRLYCKALTGVDIAIAPASGLADKHIGWISSDLPSTEGSSIFLPEVIEHFDDKARNFGVYKVYATHQTGHLEFGSFSFRFGRPGALLGVAGRQRMAEANPRTGGALTDMERFFDLFPNRKLASDLFAIAEDARIDALVTREYGGIRQAYHQVQQAEMAQRRPADGLPLRQALIELLVRLSLDPDAELYWPGSLAELLREAVAPLAAMRLRGAIVEDAAEAAIRLYDLLMTIPNRSPQELGIDPDDWEAFGAADLDFDETQLDESAAGQGGQSAEFASSEEGGDQPYESPDQVGFRGEFKPELVQLLMRMRQGDQQGDADGAQAPLTPEQLQELLEKSVEISLTDVAEGDLASSSGMFLNNLQKEVEAMPKEKKPGPGNDAGEGEDEDDGQEFAPQPKIFLYDEWDFRAGDYRPRWCRLTETVLAEGEADFYEATVREKATLVAQTRRQFELLRPEMFRKIKRLYDGEEYDLDLAIEYIAERRAGAAANDKIYWRRNKVERDVAVALLLDMSASTDEEIERRKPAYEDDFDDDPRRYLSWWASRRAHDMLSPAKRIIDVEKESIVLLIQALETIGDSYGIYGFSGYGRDNVEYYVIKDIAESFGDRIKNRIDKITPIRSTRMGPAIRHTTTKLMESDARVKILFLVSDGRPQDHGYGRDRTEKEYAIHDTKMALTEAKRRGVTPFALTVDRNGHDYLGQMCQDMGYEVLADVEALPGRLPTLYRKLTE